MLLKMNLKINWTCVFLIISLGALAQGVQKQQIDTFLEKHKKDLSIFKKGFCIEVISKNSVLYQYQSGSFNRTTVVPIASASKWLSGALIMKLVDEKLISLNDPLKKFFSDVPKDKADITIRQLFSHTAGFEEKGTMELIKMRDWDMAKQSKSIFELPLKSKPGEYFNYTGYGMQLAGRIAELVTKKDFETLFQEKIAKPLEMSNTTFVNKENTPQVAGGARSCLADYLNFLKMVQSKGLYNGKRILSEAAVAELLSDQTNGAKVGYSPFTQYKTLYSNDVQMKYGIGNWREESSKGVLEISSSPGAFGFTPWIDFKHQQYGVIATLKSEKEVYPVYVEFRNLLNKP